MGSELQQAFQLNLSGSLLDGHMLLILAIMVLAGVLGGTANFFLAEKASEQNRHNWTRYAVFGVIAALTVPLFLNMISSTLLEGARNKPVDFYVFAGFCLIYVVASRRLFENLAQRLLGQIEQVRNEVGHLKQARDALPAVKETAETNPNEVLSYNDVEVLRALAQEKFVYGNLAAVCERTGLPRDYVSQRLTVMKALGVIETRINEKNVLHWFVSARGKAVLEEVVGHQQDKKIA
ncbi:YEATS-associated helix-containing protein [Azonexus sp.]|uniref:YEATS-associated helix-containing protein n=1 Tax=Azonexus sp. TaxID=1872668 RepID=UPI0035ADDD9B